MPCVGGEERTQMQISRLITDRKLACYFIRKQKPKMGQNQIIKNCEKKKSKHKIN